MFSCPQELLVHRLQFNPLRFDFAVTAWQIRAQCRQVVAVASGAWEAPEGRPHRAGLRLSALLLTLEVMLAAGMHADGGGILQGENLAKEDLALQ